MKKIAVNKSRLVTLAAGMVALASPLLAFAGNQDLATVVNHVSSNYSATSKFITGGAYVIGAGAILHGIHRWWQKAHDNNGQIKMHSIAVPILAGGAAIAIAYTAGVPVATLFGSGASNGSDSGTTSY